MRRTLLSMCGMILSVIGVIGVVLSEFMFDVFLSVITAVSGLFTLAVRYNQQ